VKQPRRFFRTILPGISKSLDRILIRIFCLDSTKRITLSELRIMILGCRSFTTSSTTTPTAINTNKPSTPPSSQQQLKCSKSFESTVMAYIGDYIDDIEASFYLDDYNDEEYQQSQGENSCSSNTTAEDDPPTPRNGSPLFNNNNKFQTNDNNNTTRKQHYYEQQQQQFQRILKNNYE
jgi:hypothetical protein